MGSLDVDVESSYGCLGVRLGSTAVGSAAVEDDGDWEDFTCVTPWEDFVRSLEDVLRSWNACDTDFVAGDEDRPHPAFSKCLEHDGQLFSLQLVSDARLDALGIAPSPASPRATFEPRMTTPPASSAASVTSTFAESWGGTSSLACELDNRFLDFGAGDGTSLLHRWFGLRQYVLLRALRQDGAEEMSLDQLLSAATVAAGNCNISVPMLVSCDWDSLDAEEDSRGGDEDEDGEGLRSGMGGSASCKGYSAPGCKGVACSVRFHTAVACEPPATFLYLDGLTRLFLSKLRDAHNSSERVVTAVVTASVQQSWEWTKSRTGRSLPAPSLPWGGHFEEVVQVSVNATGSRGDGTTRRRVGAVTTAGTRGEKGQGFASPMEALSGTRDRQDGSGVVHNGDDDISPARMAYERGALSAIVGGNGKLLWGPAEDPLISVVVRVRWTGLRGGMAEENALFSTLDPMHGARRLAPSFGRGNDVGVCAGQWFVTARWDEQVARRCQSTSESRSPPSATDGRLASACFRLLSALVVTATMHPDTLIADLGAAAGPESPQVVAEDYRKAAVASLSPETRAFVKSIYSRCREPPIGHDDIDRILVQLFEDKDTTTGTSCRSALIADSIPRCTAAGRSPDCRGIPCHDDGAGGDRVQHKSSRHKRDDDAVPSTPGPSPSEAAGPQWRQVFPRKQARGDEQGATRLAEDFGTPTAASASTPAMSDGFSRELESSTNESEAHRAIDAGTPGRLCPNVGGTDPEDYVRSLWTWARRGGTPVGRLLSLLSIRIADCEDLASMSLLWMSFVRDVRLLWEQDVIIPRMAPITELDGRSMLDDRVCGTGQGRSVAARLRGGRWALGDRSEYWTGCNCGSARVGQPYPDMRACLIWQKLQMLNCCRTDISGRPSLVAGSISAPGHADVEDDDDDDGAFFDTREWQNSDSESESGGRGQPTQPIADRDADPSVDGEGAPREVTQKSVSAPESMAVGVPGSDMLSMAETSILGDEEPALLTKMSSEGAGHAEDHVRSGLDEQDDSGRRALESDAVDDPVGVTPGPGTTSHQSLRSPVRISATSSPPSEDVTELRLLVTGKAVQPPALQPCGPVTSDMVFEEQSSLGQAGERRGREVLLSDMEAFRRNNRDAVFADFVRWYQPDCWQQSIGTTEEQGESVDEKPPSAIDTLRNADDTVRLAWPGKGQIVWRNYRDTVSSISVRDGAPEAPPALDVRPSTPSLPSLSGWLACWCEAGKAMRSGPGAEAVTGAVKPLWNGVTEGEKALHYLETISPQSLLAQLLSALLGLSMFVLEEASSSHEGGLPVVKEAIRVAKRRVKDAVELFAEITDEESIGGADAAGPSKMREANGSNSIRRASSSSFRSALLAADAACLEVKRAERCLSRSVSLQRTLPGQSELSNALATCEDRGAEVHVEKARQKEFLRELLMAQRRRRSSDAEVAGSEDEPSASFGENERFGGATEEKDSAMQALVEDGSMPAPELKEYVLRCQTPAPFYRSNVGRPQLKAYTTPSSRMYAKTNGKHLRVAFSICESEL